MGKREQEEVSVSGKWCAGGVVEGRGGVVLSIVRVRRCEERKEKVEVCAKGSGEAKCGGSDKCEEQGRAATECDGMELRAVA